MQDTNALEHSTSYFDCSLGDTTTAVCTESFGGDEAKFPGISTETLTLSDVLYMPVVITTGLVSNTGAAETGTVTSTSTTKGGPTASNTSGTAVKTGSGSATCTAQTQTGSSQSGSATSASTATSASKAGA